MDQEPKLYQLTFFRILCSRAVHEAAQMKAKRNPQTRDARGEHGAAADPQFKNRNSLFPPPRALPIDDAPQNRLSVPTDPLVPLSNSVRRRWEETAPPVVSVKATGARAGQWRRGGENVTRRESQ